MRRMFVTLVAATFLAALMLTGCGRTSPNLPSHIGQVSR